MKIIVSAGRKMHDLPISSLPFVSDGTPSLTISEKFNRNDR